MKQGLKARSIVLGFASAKTNSSAQKYTISSSPNPNKETSKSSLLSCITAA